MGDSSGGDEREWSLILKPKRGWLDIDLREIYRYRDLVWMR